MNQMIVLVDYMDKEGYVKGVVADMGSDLMFIAEQVRMLEQMYTNQGETFLGSFVLAVERERPTTPYIPNNAFKMTYGEDMSITHPQLGKVWTTLVARIEPGDLNGEEE